MKKQIKIFPNIGIITWDLALDINEEVILIMSMNEKTCGMGVRYYV